MFLARKRKHSLARSIPGKVRVKPPKEEVFLERKSFYL
jgi:hypothetical protein